MSRLAYVTEEQRLAGYLTTGGFTLVRTIGYETRGTQAFIATSGPGTARRIGVVAFRGTEPDHPSDLFADAKFLTVPWREGGRVHGGFADALLKVFPDKADLDRVIPSEVDRVLFTGHSLGAALATLAASIHRPHYLYTFGSPRVGDTDCGHGMHDVDHSRYVDCCDIVARVPPESPRYVHVGALRYINRDGQVLGAPSEEVIKEDQHTVSRNSPTRTQSATA